MDLRHFRLAVGAAASLGLGACEAGGPEEAAAESGLEAEIEDCLDRGKQGDWSDPSNAKHCLDDIPRYPVSPHAIASVCVEGYVDCVSKTWSEELCTPILDACFACADGDGKWDGDDGHADDRDDHDCDREDWCDHDDDDDDHDDHDDDDDWCDDHDGDHHDEDGCREEWCDHDGDSDGHEDGKCDGESLKSCEWVRESCEKDEGVPVGSWGSSKCNDRYDACAEEVCKKDA